MSLTDEQILKKAIEKSKIWKEDDVLIETCKEMIVNGAYYSLIFSHSFAKAFWKHPKECKVGEPFCSNHAPWQAYLQKMVVEEQPLKYLEKWLR